MFALLAFGHARQLRLGRSEPFIQHLIDDPILPIVLCGVHTSIGALHNFIGCALYTDVGDNADTEGDRPAVPLHLFHEALVYLSTTTRAASGPVSGNSTANSSPPSRPM